jgi:alpha/beta hydrolase fold
MQVQYTEAESSPTSKALNHERQYANMLRIMRIKRNTTSLIITISLLIFFLIPSSARMVVKTILDKAVVAYGQLNNMNSNITNQMAFQNIPPKKIQVGDIDIAYKVFGNGKPLLLIAGSGATMDMWDPIVLKQLSANHNVIIFDNRGKGQTSAGTIKNMTMSQFANDTARLIDALGIQKPDVLGVSLGGFIAQELALLHPEKVDKLIIYASDCSGKVATPSNPELMQIVTNTSMSPQERVIDQARTNDAKSSTDKLKIIWSGESY